MLDKRKEKSNNERAKKVSKKKLTRSFFKVASITASVAILGLIALIVFSNRYSYALKNFGFAQGDIGKAMFEFADVRSSLRAAIGYDEADAITAVVKQHDNHKAAFLANFAKVEETLVSQEGRKHTMKFVQSWMNTGDWIQRLWNLVQQQTENSVSRHRISP